MHSTLSKFSDCQLSNTSGSEGLSFILYATRELERSLIVIFHASSEPVIRMGVLGTVGLLLDRNAELGGEGEEFAGENEERLIDVPIRMLSDINQQVSGRRDDVCGCGCGCGGCGCGGCGWVWVGCGWGGWVSG